MRARLQLTMFAIVLGTICAACRSNNAYEVGRDAQAVGLVVKNEGFADVDVYAVASGLATRVGTVNGGNTRRFDLNASIYSTPDLRIVATPIGGNGRASSGPIVVNRGNTIYFTIAPFLSASTVLIR